MVQHHTNERAYRSDMMVLLKFERLRTGSTELPGDDVVSCSAGTDFIPQVTLHASTNSIGQSFDTFYGLARGIKCKRC